MSDLIDREDIWKWKIALNATKDILPTTEIKTIPEILQKNKVENFPKPVYTTEKKSQLVL